MLNAPMHPYNMHQNLGNKLKQKLETCNLCHLFMFMFMFKTCSVLLGLASDSDKFKIIITLRRAQKFGDTGPYKNFDFLFNPLLLSLVGAIGRAGLRKEVGLLRPGPRGPKVLRHQMVRWSAGGTEYPRWWHRQVGRQQFCWFFKLDKYAMFSFAMTSGLASDSDKFKIIITLRRAQKFGDTGPYKNFDFLFNPLLLSLVGAIGRAGLRNGGISGISQEFLRNSGISGISGISQEFLRNFECHRK